LLRSAKLFTGGEVVVYRLFKGCSKPLYGLAMKANGVLNSCNVSDKTSVFIMVLLLHSAKTLERHALSAVPPAILVELQLLGRHLNPNYEVLA
jgi:hypothetical protein